MVEPAQGPPGPKVSRFVWVILAALVLLSRLPFAPNTLEDIDSTNFARALTLFDPAAHRPHPPGYPIYVAAARIVRTVVPDPVRALSALSALAQTGLLFALPLLFRGLGASGAVAAVATLLSLTSPVVWFNGARPMSDSVGLLFIVTTQALLLRSLANPRSLVLASLLVGLAPGARLQSVFLTLPLWLLAMAKAGERRLVSLLALIAGLALWLLPTLALAGGFDRYAAAFGDTIGQAAAFEPLLSEFTLNRAARALKLVLLGPWADPALGAVLLGLAALGVFATLASRSRALGLALLAFLPYLAVHALLQHVETVRYTMPYVPLFAFLAAEALLALCGRMPARAVLPLALAAWAAAVTLPALSAFAGGTSPPYSALREVGRIAQPPERFALGAHFVYLPYMESLAPGLELLLAEKAGGAVPRLLEYWKGGGHRQVLFIAEPGRTDLESVDPRARRLVGSWRWPFDDRRFLSGSRPSRAELWRIQPPGFVAADGFLLSLEAGKPSELIHLPERRTFLRARPEPTFLIVAGEPIGPAAQHTLELSLDGAPLYEHGCGEPLLRGFLLPGATSPGPYRELLALTRRGGLAEGAPFALRGLDYAGRQDAGFAHGGGWFYPEKDEQQRAFRWASVRAHTLVHVPARGARLVVEGVAPLEYVGSGGKLELLLDGKAAASHTLDEPAFRLEVKLEPTPEGFRSVLLQSERAFVPDSIQRNGDRRRLSVRVYAFHLELP